MEILNNFKLDPTCTSDYFQELSFHRHEAVHEEGAELISWAELCKREGGTAQAEACADAGMPRVTLRCKSIARVWFLLERHARCRNERSERLCAGVSPVPSC